MRIARGIEIPVLPLALAFALALSSCAHMGEGPEVEVMTTGERMTLASIYESKGKTELALREYEKAAKEGGSARAWFAIGNIHLKAANYPEAENAYINAVKINPSNGSYRNNLAWAYMMQEKLEKAEREAREALRLDADRRFAYLDTLGAVQIRRGDLDGAEASLNEALRSAPPDEMQGKGEIYSRLAELYRLKGEMDRAVVMEERARALGAPTR